MSARTEPSACCCRFCDEPFTAAGITNHERYCDENPHSGVHPDDAPDLFDETPGGEPSPGADPDQRVAEADGSGLPSSSTLPTGDKSTQSLPDESSSDGCPNCGSTDTMPSHTARQKYADEMNGLPAGLRATFDAAETYCNGCYSVSGGEIGEPYCIPEGLA